ncbi:hypothetical protein PMZ80_008732 [Knufia obscura]|uniref:Aminoglycoside phosphotransferase domain-containing protein n=1 Tax=Knufia obscura TaxID=1635080 RepID=A0ABR0RGW1_9EURO|nr:hypothetical protein PMZ80_008732 [Knufia obscura]
MADAYHHPSSIPTTLSELQTSVLAASEAKDDVEVQDDSAPQGYPDLEMMQDQAQENNTWVDFFYENALVTLDDGSQWGYLDPICEERDDTSPREDASLARAVYKCVELKDGEEGKEAVTKIYLQTHGSEHQQCPTWVVQEIAALRQLSQARQAGQDVPAPTLIGVATKRQQWWSWVPGGFCVILVMDLVPGTQFDPDEFHNQPEARQAKVRAAFKKSLMEIWSAGVYPTDEGLRNVLWHEDEQRCYIVDMEGAHCSKYPNSGGFVDAVQFYVWGFTKALYDERLDACSQDEWTDTSSEDGEPEIVAARS